MKLNEKERNCLQYLVDHTYTHGEMCVGFKHLIEWTNYTRQEVRRAVRSLARKGLAEYYKGLWTDDGEPAGAGYCVTQAGIDLLQGKDKNKEK